MDAISNADRLMAVLRQRLRQRAAKPAGRDATPATADAPMGLDALAALTDADPAQLRRACVQALLAEELGRHLLNDSQFHQIVTRVTDAIARDAPSARLLDRIVRDLR